MLYFGDAILVAESRRRDLERAVEVHRMLKEAERHKPRLSHIIQTWAGKQMVILGEKMQKPAMEPCCNQLRTQY